MIGAAPCPARAAPSLWAADLRVDTAHSTNHTATSIEDPGLYHLLGGSLRIHPLSLLSIGYEGSAYLRSDVDDRNAYHHALRASVGTPSRGRRFFWGGSADADWSRHDFDLEYYDRQVVTAEGNAGWRPLAVTLLTARAGFTSTRWSFLPEMDANDVWGSVRANVSLPSRTSLTLTASLENRSYIEDDALVNEVLESPLAVQLSRFRRGTGTGGSDGGNIDGDDSSDGSDLAGPGSGHGSGDGPPGVVLTTADGTPDALLRSISLRVAQNIAPKVGVSVTGSWRGAADYLNRYYESEEQPLLLEATAYDERFSYQMSAVKGALNVRLSSSRRLEFGGRYETRDFVGRPALDMVGDPVGGDREDRRVDTHASFLFSLATLPVRGELTVRYVNNESNDLLYDYDQLMVLVGTKWRLH